MNGVLVLLIIPAVHLPAFHSSFHLSRARPSVDWNHHKIPSSSHVVEFPAGGVPGGSISVRCTSLNINRLTYVYSRPLTVSAVGYTLQLGRCPSILNLGSTTNAARQRASYQTSLFSTSSASPATPLALAFFCTRPSYVHSMLSATHCLLCRQSGSTILHLVFMPGSFAS